MQNFTIKANAANIVVVGNFNPAIFHPQWFNKHLLLPERECERADIDVVHNEISRFSIGGYQLEVLTNRLLLRTDSEAQFSEMRDLSVSIFDILSEIPVNQIGFNRQIDISCAELSEWHEVGHKIAPKEIWMKCLPSVNPDEIGTKNLEIQSSREDGIPGKINISVFPPKPKYITFKVNHHIEFKKLLASGDDISPSSFIAQEWERLNTNSNDIIMKAIQEL